MLLKACHHLELCLWPHPTRFSPNQWFCFLLSLLWMVGHSDGPGGDGHGAWPYVCPGDTLPQA